MDQQLPRGRSPSLSIKQSHSPSASPARPFGSQQFTSQPDYSAYNGSGAAFLTTTQPGLDQPDLYDPNQSFADQLKTDPGATAFGQPFLGPQQSFTDDFQIFPAPSAEQLATPLFDPQQPQEQQQNPFGHQSINMATSQAPHSPTPPHLLAAYDAQPSSTHQSPSFNNHQFVPQAGRHSRNVSLGPEAALMPGQDWSAAHFQGHRRNGSEYSDASSIGGHSPSLVGQDTFSDPIEQLESSPMIRPDEGHDVYQELNGINSFSISGRSPSHSPAMSPRIAPQAPSDMNPAFLQAQNDEYTQYMLHNGQEAFPQLPSQDMSGIPQMTAPTIEIQFAPNPAVRPMFEGKPVLDTGALIPPDQRGRPRRRAITDPYSGGGGQSVRAGHTVDSLSPNLGADLGPRSEAARSLSPLDRSGSAAAGNRRRLSTSAVPPNNAIALRLVNDQEFGTGVPDTGAACGAAGAGTKRAQKHPATFQCTLCPKRFTRAYNLRSHLRTHTDERPFVCTYCSKAFARQHDRKRHEGLHSGEKKFVCKGDLKVGGDWGCGRRFARADALGRHFRSEAGRICIKPLLDEEAIERQRMWQEQNMQAHAAAQQSMMMVQGPPPVDPSAGYPIDAQGNYLPAALLAQYPALAQVNWNAVDMGGGGSGMEDDLSGRSSFDASDLEDGDDGGYVSGPGTGFGDGGMGENFGEIGYTSDFGGR